MHVLSGSLVLNCFLVFRNIFGKTSTDQESHDFSTEFTRYVRGLPLHPLVKAF